jgi:hypothetical protein
MLGFERTEMYATVLDAGPGSFEPVVVDASQSRAASDSLGVRGSLRGARRRRPCRQNAAS